MTPSPAPATVRIVPSSWSTSLAGSEMACVGYPYVVSGWIAVDTILRHVEGMPIPASDGGFPRPLLLMKQNSSDWKPAVTTDEPADYAALFKQLWKLG